jgi:ATPase subunit of ABC transporter with duplicated ATPase domains
MYEDDSNAEIPEGLIAELSGGLEGNGEADAQAQAGAEGQAAAEPLIAFSHVSISFDGRAVLEDVSFHVERGRTASWGAAEWGNPSRCGC